MFFPSPGGVLTIDMKRQLFDQLSAEIGRQVNKAGLKEEQILSDFVE